MAESQIAGLFMTPEMYRANQRAEDERSAMAFAKLPLGQRADYGAALAGSQFGGALGRMLGGEDPQLRMITQQQQLLRGLDMSDPKALAQAAQRASDAGNPRMAQALIQQAMLLQKDSSVIAKNLRERQSLDPIHALIAAGKYTPPSVDRYRLSGVAADLELIDKPERLTQFGAERNAYSQEMFAGKNYSDLSPDQMKAVNVRITEEKGGVARQGAARFVMPGDKALADIPAFRHRVQTTIEPHLKAITASDQALEAIDLSLSTNNFIAFQAAKVQFARAISGAGDLSRRELEAAGADPSLIGGTADYISKMFTSTPTEDTQKKIRDTLNAIRKVASAKAKAEVAQQGRIALLSPGYTRESVNEALTFRELDPRQPLGTVTPQPKASLRNRPIIVKDGVWVFENTGTKAE